MPLSTQIRKRPRDQTNRQKDWPEKRHKTFSSPTNTTSSIKDASPNKAGNFAKSLSHHDITKIEENNPEMLAKKIIEQGRSLEKSKSTEALSVLSPKSINNVCNITPQSSGVEVRKVETIDTHYSKLNHSPTRFHRSSASNATSPRNSFQHQSSVTYNEAYNNHDRSRPTQHIPNYNQHRSAGANVNNSNGKSPIRSVLVDLPKVDLKLSLNNTSSDPMANSIAAAMSSAGHQTPSFSHSHKEPPLVLPPHPNSRSHSSEGQTGEDTFASTKGNFAGLVYNLPPPLKNLI